MKKQTQNLDLAFPLYMFTAISHVAKEMANNNAASVTQIAQRTIIT